jgi:hypothetical protein
MSRSPQSLRSQVARLLETVSSVSTLVQTDFRLQIHRPILFLRKPYGTSMPKCSTFIKSKGFRPPFILTSSKPRAPLRELTLATRDLSTHVLIRKAHPRSLLTVSRATAICKSHYRIMRTLVHLTIDHWSFRSKTVLF